MRHRGNNRDPKLAKRTRQLRSAATNDVDFLGVPSRPAERATGNENPKDSPSNRALEVAVDRLDLLSNPAERPGNENPKDSPSNRALEVAVELRGFEPLTPSLRTRCSAELSYSPKGVESYQDRRRTPDRFRRRRPTWPGYQPRRSRSARRRSWIIVVVRSARLRSTKERETSVVRRKPPVMPSG